ncbi:MAG: GNAT family N-acetyltransferase [Paracoccaceae bacterium]
MKIDALQLYDVIEGTWPPARVWVQDGWTLRDGAGGGKRVSAATVAVMGDVPAGDAPPLVMVREGEHALDAMLAQQGYAQVDPVNLYTCPVEQLTDVPIPKVTAFAIWEPLAIMAEIWAAGGIGPDRIAVMERAMLKTGILSRWNEKPAGTAFAAIHNGVSMVHAVEVLPHQRRQGVAAWMMRKAAFWAAEHGAAQMTVLCTQENAGANALYASLGMQRLGGYHYRQKDV